MQCQKVTSYIATIFIVALSFIQGGCASASERQASDDVYPTIFNLISGKQNSLGGPLRDSYEDDAKAIGSAQGAGEAKAVFTSKGFIFLVPVDRLMVGLKTNAEEKDAYGLIDSKTVKLLKIPGTAHNNYSRPMSYIFAVEKFMGDFNREMYRLYKNEK